MAPEFPTQTAGSQPPAPAVPAKVFPDEINLKEAEALVGLTTQRLRKILTEGKIPADVAKKNGAGAWRFSKAKLAEWAKNRPRGVRTSANGARTYKVQVNPDQKAAIEKAIPGIVFKPAFNYDPAKAKAYRAKKFQEKQAAAKAVAAK